MNRYLAILLLIWWAGAGTATVALFIPIYNNYVLVGSIGWGIVVVCTFLIFFEMKRVKADDKKKENLKNG
jgi:hypothetical protein